MKPEQSERAKAPRIHRSIHPQGWVPIETRTRTTLDTHPMRSSIHPQGWVPIETWCVIATGSMPPRSIHPQGWVPIETLRTLSSISAPIHASSIHPQGWVPIETAYSNGSRSISSESCSIHPQGWVPIETTHVGRKTHATRVVAFTPKGGCPLKRSFVIIGANQQR